MSPAEEKARLAMVQLAIERLLESGPQTRIELFGETNSQPIKGFQRSVIKTLENGGIIYRADTGTPPITRVHLKNRTKATSLLEDPVALSRVVWPTAGAALLPPELPVEVAAPQEPVVLIVKDEAPQEQTTTPEGQVPAPTFPPPDTTTQQLLERLLVVMDAACQSIIYTRDKVDALELKINHLWEQLK